MGAQRQLFAQLYVTVIQHLPGGAADDDVALQAGGYGGASGQLHGRHHTMECVDTVEQWSTGQR